MILALKLMREVIDDVINEARNAGDPLPDDYQIWRSAGLNNDAWASRTVQLVREQAYTRTHFRPTPRE